MGQWMEHIGERLQNWKVPRVPTHNKVKLRLDRDWNVLLSITVVSFCLPMALHGWQHKLQLAATITQITDIRHFWTSSNYLPFSLLILLPHFWPLSLFCSTAQRKFANLFRLFLARAFFSFFFHKWTVETNGLARAAIVPTLKPAYTRRGSLMALINAVWLTPGRDDRQSENSLSRSKSRTSRPISIFLSNVFIVGKIDSQQTQIILLYGVVTQNEE